MQSFEFGAQRITANGISVCYYRSGGDKPPVVLAHGMTDNSLCWSQVASGLTHRYDVVLYDARGHGQSESPETGHDPETRAEDLRELVLALGLERPRLLGHSMGAMTVALLAARHPELARCVVLEDPPMPPNPTQTLSEADRGVLDEHWQNWRQRATAQKSMSRQKLFATCRNQSPHWHETEITHWVDAKLQASLDIFNSPNLMTSDWWQELSRITCPSLLVTSDVERGALVSEAAADVIRSLSRQGTVVRLPGAGHNIHRDQYDRFMSIVTDFFART